MVYICSDIHGEYDLFIKLLYKINFSSSDVMYICGDVLDKGSNGVRLLKLIKDIPNISMIIGNHEYDFLKYYWAIMRESPEDFDEVLKKLQTRLEGDGYLLDWDTIDYLESLPYFIETNYFILVHAGLPVDKATSEVLLLEKVAPEYLVYDRKFKEPKVLPKTNKCIFFGHTPTSYLCGAPKILKYKKQEHIYKDIRDYIKIHLDIGTWLDGVMACFCVDTLEEIYVTK